MTGAIRKHELLEVRKDMSYQTLSNGSVLVCKDAGRRIPLGLLYAIAGRLSLQEFVESGTPAAAGLHSSVLYGGSGTPPAPMPRGREGNALQLANFPVEGQQSVRQELIAGGEGENPL